MTEQIMQKKMTANIIVNIIYKYKYNSISIQCQPVHIYYYSSSSHTKPGALSKHYLFEMQKSLKEEENNPFLAGII